MNEDQRWFWQRKRWQVWLSGLLQGMIHGLAMTGGAVLSIGASNMTGITTIPQLTPKQFGVILFWGAVSGGIAFLRQSPVPRAEDDTTPPIPPSTSKP